MEDKKTLGKFIQIKRKENNLSQKELAQKLYVTESAVSKWERGISYPDITMISGICQALNISEHELCTASEDFQQRQTELMAKDYRRFKLGYSIITGICYASAIIPSFIVNFIVNKTVGWFFILLTSLMLVFSIINIPILVKRNKALITLGSFWLSLNLLLASGCIYSNGDWFLMAFISITLALSLIFLPFILRTDFLRKYVGNNKSLIYFTVNSLLTIGTVLYGTYKYGSIQDTKSGITALIISLLPVWLCFVIVRYLSFNGFFKASLCLCTIELYLCFVNKLYSLFQSNKLILSISYPQKTIVLTVIFIAAFICALAGIIYKLKDKKDRV